MRTCSCRCERGTGAWERLGCIHWLILELALFRQRLLGVEQAQYRSCPSLQATSLHSPIHLVAFVNASIMNTGNVQRLVSLYDTPQALDPLPAGQSPRSSPQTSSRAQLNRTEQRPSSLPHPPPTPARFLKHSPSHERDKNVDVDSNPSISLAGATASAHSTSIKTLAETTADIADELGVSNLHFREGSGNARKARLALGRSHSRSPSHSDEELLLPERSHTNQYHIPSTSSVDYTHQTSLQSSKHTAIALATICSRNAAPLSLPRLDAYISSLPSPSFATVPDKVVVREKMFVPMDRLAACGRSIEDLEVNAQIAPSWRNRKSIFGSLVNIFLGITVCQMHLLSSLSQLTAYTGL